jgi:hypothetical protein
LLTQREVQDSVAQELQAFVVGPLPVPLVGIGTVGESGIQKVDVLKLVTQTPLEDRETFDSLGRKFYIIGH